MEFAGWIAAFAVQDAYARWTTPDRVSVLCKNIAAMAAHPVAVRPAWTEQFLWNLQWSVAELIWDEQLGPSDRKRLITDVASVLRSVAELMPDDSPAVNQFWDSIIEVHDRIGTTSTSAELGQHLYGTLRWQASIRNEMLQRSALHGLNHLRDPRTPGLIDSMRQDWVSPDVASYAEIAKRFSAP